MINWQYPAFWNKKSYISILLLPLSLIYFIISKIRYIIARPVRFSAQVICVGNATVGGTGKTQVVKWLATLLSSQNMKVVIICKGYKSSFKASTIVQPKHSPYEVGDEAKYLSQIAQVVICKNPKSCAKIVNLLNPDIIIMDDFLQNPNFVKNVGLLIIDADRMYGNGLLLPAGPLRQSVKSAVKKVTAIIAIGSGKDGIIDNHNFFAQIVSSQKFDLNAKYVAFAGIGNPERFFSCLRQHGLNIVREVKFVDHHNYSAHDVENLRQIANDAGARLITTPKDAIKLDMQTLVFEPELKFQDNAETKILTSIYEDLKKNNTFI